MKLAQEFNNLVRFGSARVVYSIILNGVVILVIDVFKVKYWQWALVSTLPIMYINYRINKKVILSEKKN